MLPNLSACSLGADPGSSSQQQKRGNVPQYFDDLSMDIINRILEFPKDTSCRDVLRMCSTSKYFQMLCNVPEFWQHQSHLRKYDRDARIAWYRQKMSIGADAPIDWKQYYLFWCDRQHTNETLWEATKPARDPRRAVTIEDEFYGPISIWDTSQVTDMQDLFLDAIHFNGDISQWDVSNVKNMSWMFFKAYEFDGNLSRWDVSNVLEMSSMFSFATNFTNGIFEVKEGWKVLLMNYMFYHAENFNADLSNWHVSSVRHMSGMFNHALEFNADVSEWDVSNVTYMSHMFNSASSFNQDLTSWTVPNDTHLGAMFEGSAMIPAQYPRVRQSSSSSSASGLNVSEVSAKLPGK